MELDKKMRILCLYSNDIALELFEWLKNQNCEVIIYNKKLTVDYVNGIDVDLTVSYTYQYIIEDDIIALLNNNIVNLHNSYLPFNRGASPNLWSIIDGTPSGVTLHYIDKGIDTGDVISQEIVRFDKEETLRTSYLILDRKAKEHFKKMFMIYNDWPQLRKKVLGKGSFHKDSDLESVRSKIDNWDWDMKISVFLEKID